MNTKRAVANIATRPLQEQDKYGDMKLQFLPPNDRPSVACSRCTGLQVYRYNVMHLTAPLLSLLYLKTKLKQL